MAKPVSCGRFAVVVLFAVAFSLAGLECCATEIPERNWEYEQLDEDHVVIHNPDQSRWAAAIDPKTEGDIAVPATLRNLLVVSIGEKAFCDCTKLTSVVIPEGVTNIADNAFYGCTSLTNVVFPTSLKSVGTYAFYNCSKLAAANFTGASLTIGTHAFRDCAVIRELTFSGDMIDIGECAFSGCTELGDVSLLAKKVKTGRFSFSIYHVGWNVHSSACTGLTNVLVQSSDAAISAVSFSGCTALRNANLSAHSLSVGERAFSKYNYYGNDWTSPCTKLGQVDVTSSNLTVSASSFANCSSLSNAVLVGSVSARVGESAFSGCSRLRNIELPIALIEVASNVFCKCTSLEGVSSLTNVAKISYQAFDTCTALKTIGLPEGLETIADQAFYGCDAITDLVFPQSLVSVGARAFQECANLSNVVFAEGDTNHVAARSVSIGERAFYRCCSLTNAMLSQAVSSVGSRAFSQCDALEGVMLPTNLASIAESSFECCVALPEIDLPDSLRSIGNTAFSGCTNLASFLIPTNNVVTLGVDAFKDTKYWRDYPDDLVVNNGYVLGFKGNPTAVTLPDGCTEISVGMFEGMTTLRSVTIPDSVTEIGSRAFNGCSGITNLAFKNVTKIGNSAFEGCTSLSGISLSEPLTALPGNCFKDCTSLTEVFIPDAVESVGEYAFYGCASLNSVTGGAGVGEVGDYAFGGCVSLQPFSFPDGVVYGDHVFLGVEWTENVLFPSVGTLRDEYPNSYSNIRSVVMSSSMTTIVDRACAGCASLEWVKIPESVLSIGVSAFSGCGALTSVVLHAELADVEAGAFDGCPSVSSLVTSGQFEIRGVFPDSYARMADVTLAEGAASLCSNALAGCSAIRSIEILPTVETIGAGAFAGCAGLRQVEIPETVRSIGDEAFKNCTGLSSVSILCADAQAGSGLFAGCSSVRTVATATSLCFSDAFPSVYAKLSSVELLEGMTSFVDSAFAGCAALVSVKIPSTVTSIGSSAFSGCVGLSPDIIIPASVTSLGDYAFRGCTGLTRVNYFGNKPSGDMKGLYDGANQSLRSGVLKDKKASWGGVSVGTNSAALFWPGLPSAGGRRLVTWPPTDEEFRTYGMMKFYYYDRTGLCEIKDAVEGLSVEPSRDKYTFAGWYSAPYSGVEVTEDNASDFAAVYAHWIKEGSEEEEEEEPSEWDDVSYDVKSASVYDGYLLDGSVVAGTIQVKAAKGKYDKSSESTSVRMTATVLLLGEGKKVSLQGTAEDVDESGGAAELTGGGSAAGRELSVSFSANELTGSLGDYDVVAARNVFTGTTAFDKRVASAAVESFGGTYVVSLKTEGDAPFASGFLGLTVKVGSKGKASVSGTLPDGTKVSVSSQLLVGPEGGEVPVVAPLYAHKTGGFGFVIKMSDEEETEFLLDGLTDWSANPGEDDAFVATLTPADETGVGPVAGLVSDAEFSVVGGFEIPGVTVDSELLPVGVAVSVRNDKWSVPKADTVKFNQEAGTWEIVKDNGNPAGLRLSYSASTGTFTGKFVVYAVTDAGKSRKYTANVTGVVLNGVGYGTARVEKVGSCPVLISGGL